MEQALLLKVADTKQLTQPALLFVDPAVLGSLDEPHGADARSYETLVKKLFGDLESD